MFTLWNPAHCVCTAARQVSMEPLAQCLTVRRSGSHEDGDGATCILPPAKHGMLRVSFHRCANLWAIGEDSTADAACASCACWLAEVPECVRTTSAAPHSALDGASWAHDEELWLPLPVLPAQLVVELRLDHSDGNGSISRIPGGVALVDVHDGRPVTMWARVDGTGSLRFDGDRDGSAELLLSYRVHGPGGGIASGDAASDGDEPFAAQRELGGDEDGSDSSQPRAERHAQPPTRDRHGFPLASVPGAAYELYLQQYEMIVQRQRRLWRRLLRDDNGALSFAAPLLPDELRRATAIGVPPEVWPLSVSPSRRPTFRVPTGRVPTGCVPTGRVPTGRVPTSRTPCQTHVRTRPAAALHSPRRPPPIHRYARLLFTGTPVAVAAPLWR